MLRPEIFTHARDWQRLTSTHPKGDPSPPPKENRENLKFALKFSVLESITSRIVEVFSLKFFMRLTITARGNSSSWNWFCTMTCGAGRPHVWLCHALLVLHDFCPKNARILIIIARKIFFPNFRGGGARAPPCPRLLRLCRLSLDLLVILLILGAFLAQTKCIVPQIWQSFCACECLAKLGL